MPDSPVLLRKTTVHDAKHIHALILRCSRDGSMMPRSMNEIYERIRSFRVLERRGRIIGCCCLHIMWDDLAEIKSLAVDPAHRGKNYGAIMVRDAIEEARELKVKQVFALTFIPDFFKQFGFKKINMNKLPKKIWIECVNCIHYPDCDETAVIRNVEEK